VVKMPKRKRNTTKQRKKRKMIKQPQRKVGESSYTREVIIRGSNCVLSHYIVQLEEF
jgi:hypothetical protein